MSSAAPTPEELEAFGAEAHTWLEENFPSSLAGRGAELSGEFLDTGNADLNAWCERLGQKGWGAPRHFTESMEKYVRPEN